MDNQLNSNQTTQENPFTQSVTLLGFLRDRLVEAADCLETGIDITKNAGLTTSDLERQIADCRFFAEEAGNFLSTVSMETRQAK
ncbi:hypothetical protein [Vibrio coralliilyticus]|uniref:hypothetical protein n=1 Tax=Vibrio coralliilyticus TaxID=190893 RepID=UPI0020A4C6C1|nr:hypothetical protein [Vibrio coralliilyticus]WFB49887.1 hypothetical protein P6988_23900 [Vibrio coralliilyticus]